MTFKNAYLKLSLFYVAILMTISIIFSFAIYRISTDELDSGLGNQIKMIYQAPKRFGSSQSLEELEKIRIEQLKESNSRLKTNLIYYNLLILFISGLISYYFARKTLQPLEEMVESQNRFTADASHELRTPLTAMRTEIEVNLRDKDLKFDEAKKLLKSNLEEIEKLESLSSALLKLARHKDGDKTVFKEVLLEDVIVEAYEKVESLANKKEIEFDNNLKDLIVLGDKQSLVELFVILMDNAIKYSPDKSKVKINLEEVNGKVLIRIKDQGIGIKASDLPYIFNRFYRADLSRSKEKISGYGLGLAIAKQIVDFHGGTISAISSPGKGSEFIVELG